MKVKKIAVKIMPGAFFIFMMVFHMTHSALWGDEWIEYTYSQASIMNGDMYEKIVSTFQPPLYNFLMHFWLKVNTSILWFRSFNILFGCIAGGFLFCTLRELYNEKVAGILLCILGSCYQWIYCIQECSEYALMLCCLFGALFFYVLLFRKFTWWRMICFIICNVLAIYSQYGSVFVALPLLLLFFVGNVFNKTVERKRKIWIIISYFISLLIFAVPLYIFFLRQQMENNQISSNTVKLTSDLLMDLPFTMGHVLGYFYNVNSGDIWPVIMGVVGIVLIIISVFVLVNGKSWEKNSLILALWIGYIAHYFLVKLHIYAMTHPNQSAGFFERYSYFYIPMMSIALPVLVMELSAIVPKTKCFGLYNYFLWIPGILCVGLSLFSILQNWNKTLDDQFALIWMENEGWKDITYLYGMAPYGFNYYVSHTDGYEEGYLDNATSSVDNNNLPPKFWAWRTNWGGSGWRTTIDTAVSLGYNVTIYIDSNSVGQLAYCSYDGENE